MGTASAILIMYVVSSALNAPRVWQHTGPQPEYHVINFAFSNWVLAVVVVLWMILLASALLTALIYSDDWPYAVGSCIFWGLALFFALLFFWPWYTGYWIGWLIALVVLTFVVMVACLLMHLFADSDKLNKHRAKVTDWRERLRRRVIGLGPRRVSST